MKKKSNKPVSDLPVMKAHCKTCPFRVTGERPGVWQNHKLAAAVIERNLFKSQQVCHGTQYIGKKKARNRCKGFFDYAFEIYKRMGLDPEKNLLNNPE